MRLAPFATEADVDEALRLFQVSTLDAALSGNLAGVWQGFTFVIVCNLSSLNGLFDIHQYICATE